MTILLLANIGNHDVKLDDHNLLPVEMQEGYIPSRKLGQELAANYARYGPAITLPILGPTLHWLIEHQGIDPQDLKVYLFASDQNPAFTPAGEWLKDTYPFAQVIERHLKEGGLAWPRGGKGPPKPLRLTRKQIRTHCLEGNPADYRNALTFFSRELPRLAEWVGEIDKVYLEVSGGTPAMTAMLILAGVEVFGRKTQTLYMARDADRPDRVGIGRQLFARHARATLRTQIQLHAYAVARQELEKEGPLTLPDDRQRTLLLALLDYAHRRLAFDFDRARDALSKAQRHATGELQAQVGHWNRQLCSPGAYDLLAELIHSAHIKYQQGAYADFVNRLFRFQEAAFRHLAEQMGLEYKNPPDDRFVSKAWIEGVAGMSTFLKAYDLGDGKRGIKLDIPLNRVSLGAIVDFFRKDAAWSHYRDAAEKLHALSSLARLRNKGISGHGFEGIGKADLSQAFGDDADRIVPFLKDIYQAIFEEPIGPDPYAAINVLCTRMLES